MVMDVVSGVCGASDDGGSVGAGDCIYVINCFASEIENPVSKPPYAILGNN